MAMLWAFSCFAFFLIPYYLSSIKEADIYVLSLATEAAELTASLICLYIARIMDLRKAFGLFGSLTCIAALAILIFRGVIGDSNSGSQIISYVDGGLIMLCNLGVVCTFDIVYLLNPELFPTIYLATSFGLCNIVGRFVSIFSPIVARVPNPYPLVILMCFGGASVFLSSKLNKC